MNTVEHDYNEDQILEILNGPKSVNEISQEEFIKQAKNARIAESVIWQFIKFMFLLTEQFPQFDFEQMQVQAIRNHVNNGRPVPYPVLKKLFAIWTAVYLKYKLIAEYQGIEAVQFEVSPRLQVLPKKNL